MSSPVTSKGINVAQIYDQKTACDPVRCSIRIDELTKRGKVTIRDLNEAIQLYEKAMENLTWLEFGTSPDSGERLTEYQKEALASLKQAASKINLENSNHELYRKLENFSISQWIE